MKYIVHINALTAVLKKYLVLKIQTLMWEMRIIKHKWRTNNSWAAAATFETKSFLNADVVYFILFQIRRLEIWTGIF